MSRDYARKNRRSPRWYTPRQKSSFRKKLAWLSLILLMVILPAFILSLSTLKKHSTPKTTSLIKKTTLVTKPPKQSEPVHFDFYTILPTTTVDITGETSVQLEKRLSYIVQIASFKKLKDAKNYHKKLKKMGFNTDIHVLQRNYTKWYRIQIGPFDNKDFAQEIHDRLQERNINSLIVSV
jgi:cell division protein FtsN